MVDSLRQHAAAALAALAHQQHAVRFTREHVAPVPVQDDLVGVARDDRRHVAALPRLRVALQNLNDRHDREHRPRLAPAIDPDRAPQQSQSLGTFLDY
jgi:hypothetical protein